MCTCVCEVVFLQVFLLSSQVLAVRSLVLSVDVMCTK